MAIVYIKKIRSSWNKMLEIIEKNIANPDLQVELLSSEMGYSTRQFYRKLKPITEQSPADIIKEYRLTMAERLLIAKNLTIEEIMDQTGFNNRGTFYKLFSKRYGMPPRQYREQQKENVRRRRYRAYQTNRASETCITYYWGYTALFFLKFVGLQPLYFLNSLFKWLSSVKPNSATISLILISLCNNLFSTSFSL